LYDLVILDIKMPKMGGFELYNEIKKKDNNANVCFLTASELYYEEFRKKEVCVLDRNLFIRKPIENEELVKKITKMIKKSDLNRK
jgi:DNA-binding response OmpR family regulator